ncbi:MAG TPA: hypothetical protein VGE40_07695 [Bacilli bacterium]
MLNNFIMWGCIIVPWLSLLLMKKDTVKRFMPVSIFTSLLMTIYNELGYTFRWWEVKQTIVPWVITYVPFVYGSFLAGTIWIFYFTYGRFMMYFLTNIIVDFIFMFPVSRGFELLGMYELVNRNRWNIYFDLILISLVIFGFQLWQEGIFKSRGDHKKREPLRVDITKIFGIKRKAR